MAKKKKGRKSTDAQDGANEMSSRRSTQEIEELEQSIQLLEQDICLKNQELAGKRSALRGARLAQAPGHANSAADLNAAQDSRMTLEKAFPCENASLSAVSRGSRQFKSATPPRPGSKVPNVNAKRLEWLLLGFCMFNVGILCVTSVPAWLRSAALNAGTVLQARAPSLHPTSRTCFIAPPPLGVAVDCSGLALRLGVAVDCSGLALRLGVAVDCSGLALT
ncbi:hypothetical protein CYMTET_54298 [Cymbomonas tetramitiformis]|uniref:Uncharacterized protein n=1 Tax=Cymbomonas tetramitiformis TaxID=36881 RepID=A0AAE0ENV6_9CHLO|nr:hypothetical protein CYMTET_54298 [Cymbomonas tetramitiformis]